MRRVLIVTYHFPPRQSIGSLRPMGLARHLPLYGWEPVVLTPQLPDGPRPAVNLIETGYQDVLSQWKSRLGFDPQRSVHQQLSLPKAKKPNRVLPHTRVMKWLKPLLLFPDVTKGWMPFAMEAVAELKKTTHVDAILTTSPPITCNLIGAQAKELLGVPWLADFRDLWSQDTSARNDGENSVFHFFDRRLEARILDQADAVVTVSGPWASRLQQRVPRTKVQCITNAFDPEDFNFLPVPLTKTFSITYTGLLYEGKRDPTPLLEALLELIQAGNMKRADVDVRFYGPPEPWLIEIVRKYGLEDVVHINPMVKRQEALRRQAESQMLLLLGWHDPNERGQHTGKLFEYLGSRRPILAVSGYQGVMSEVLDETRAGVHALSKEQLRSVLAQAYAQYRTSGQVAYQALDQELKAYTQQEMARRFAEVLDGMVGQQHPAVAATPQPELSATV
jgi:glycosyltransferase involved in cell wall biosynthesis